jgi:hypothetical protein
MKDNETPQQAIIESMVQETWMMVENLNGMAEREPELLIPIARKQIVWPGFISTKAAYNRKNSELMEKIQLGKDSPFSSGEWRPNAPSTQRAIWLYWLGRRRAKQCGLPQKITKKNKKAWFDKAWRCAIKKLNWEPEKDPALARLGESAKRYYKRENPKVRMSLAVRAEIKRQVWHAFDRLVLTE